MKKNCVAIVGGGIAGIYAAWRLLQHNSAQETGAESSGGDCVFEIHLYERDDRLGGRIRSEHVSGTPFYAELGAMRFRPRHQLLNALIDELKITSLPFNLPPPAFYIRGRRLTNFDIATGYCSSCQAEIPFRLKENERGKSAVDLVRYAIREVLQGLNFPGLDQRDAKQLKRRIKEDYLNTHDWTVIKTGGVYQGLPLYNIGFWNLLQHFLSNEAYVLVHDVLSLESILGNWNAAEALPWFISDFSSDQFDMIPGGLSRVADKLVDKINPKKHKKLASMIHIHYGHRVEVLNHVDEKWRLKHNRADEPESFDQVILALPRRALRNLNVLKDGGPYLKGWAFEAPKDGGPDARKRWVQKAVAQKPADAQKSEEELKWPPKWVNWVSGHRMFKLFLLYENEWWVGDHIPGHATGRIFTDLPLRQIYYYGPNWMEKHGVIKEAVDAAVTLKDEIKKNKLALLMASYSDEHYVNYWEPILSSPDQPYLEKSDKLSDKAWEEVRNLPVDVLAKRRMVEKVHQMLTEIHGRDSLPKPIFGVARDWDAGWHTWNVGARPWEVKEETTQPFKNLFLCGEAYSGEQGWIEGALKSTELVLCELRVREPVWRRGRGVSGYRHYISE